MTDGEKEQTYESDIFMDTCVHSNLFWVILTNICVWVGWREGERKRERGRGTERKRKYVCGRW